ncbi:MAG: hypothetical protein ACLR56_10995 [Oscillospiraceae bacterium]
MAMLITKFKYLKTDERNHFGGYGNTLHREGVEKIDESKEMLLTNKQKQLIRNLLDFPDSKSLSMRTTSMIKLSVGGIYYRRRKTR